MELGLRNFAKSGFFGAFAYSTEEYLNRLELPEGPIYGVMVDAKTILTSDLSLQDAIDALFVDSQESRVDLVRIAAHFHEVEESGDIVKALKKKGYLVGFNLMQSSGKSCEIIAEKARLANSWEVLDVLYFADSLGNMDSTEVKRIVNAIRQEWFGEIGIHTHNNMAKALDNSMVAKSLGVTWIDATITGMGRGAGNAQTENLLAMLSKDSEKYSPSSIYELAIKIFEPMQKECGWGSNLMYFLGALHNVHPTYIQNLLSDTHYGTEEVIGAIEYLKRLDESTSYDASLFRQAISFSGEISEGTTKIDISGINVSDEFGLAREVLLLANGPSLSKYVSDVEAYIKKNKPVVIAVNAIDTISEEFIDFYCISHNTKFFSEKGRYSKLGKPVFLPKQRFSDEELRAFGNNRLIDFGLIVENHKMEINPNYCIVPFDVTTAYALSIAINAKVTSIKVVGFDGYLANDKRHLEMVEIINIFKGLLVGVELSALTPTTYPIEQRSIYEPIL